MFLKDIKSVLIRKARQLGWHILGYGPGAVADDASQIDASSSISPKALIRGSVVGPYSRVTAMASIRNSTLTANVLIETGSEIMNSRINEWAALGSDVAFDSSSLGSYSYIASGALLTGTSVGLFCSIGPGVVCGYGDHPANWISSSPVFYSPNQQCGTTFLSTSNFKECEPVIIGNDVWIGANAVIRNGVAIGHGAIVGAGACVVCDVPPYSIMGGVPAKLIRMRFESSIVERLLKVEWWSFPPTTLKDNAWRWNTEDAEEFLGWAEKERILLGRGVHG